MKKPRSDFPWHKVRQFIDDLDSEAAASPDGSILVTPETKRYIRFQRYLHKKAMATNPNASRDALIQLASDFGLSPLQAKCLLDKLRSIKQSYDLGARLGDIQKARDYKKALGEVKESLRILASFAGEVLSEDRASKDEIVEKRLENAAHLWADRVRQKSEKPESADEWESSAAPHGFVHRVDMSLGYPVHSYNSGDFVRRWLDGTRLMKELVDGIFREKPRKVFTDELGEPLWPNCKMTATVRLTGVDLPNLYERISGKEYGFSQALDGGGLLNTTGPKFVSMCFAVMGMQATKLETLRTQHNTARKLRGETPA